jgi:hypothetical protein
MIKITTTNSKLGGFIPQINLPALVTCRKNAPCAKYCYARKGNFTFPKVQESIQNNLNEFLNDSKGYFKQIIDFLNNGEIIYKFFRWHSSGDIVNAEYLKGMVEVAKKCKHTKFLAFTKKFEIVNEYLASGEKLPKNLSIVFSAWDKTFKVDNPFNLPMTYVFFKKEENNADIPEFSFPCNGSCQNCKACWNLKKGQSVYFHQH